jgi:hypothetical protein
MSCPDPNCILCRLERSLGLPPSDPKPITYDQLVDELEAELRRTERAILTKERAIADTMMKPAPADCEGLWPIAVSMARDEAEYYRARVKKYRALLAEEIGRRVVATAPKAEVSK